MVELTLGDVIEMMNFLKGKVLKIIADVKLITNNYSDDSGDCNESPF